MSFSITELKNKPLEMILQHPLTKKPIKNPETKKEVIFLIVNQDSKSFYDAQYEAQAKLRQIYEDTKVLPTPEQTREATYVMVSSLVVGWTTDTEEFLSEELGDDSKYSKENAFKILSNDDYFWIVKQVEEFIADKTRFFKTQSIKPVK